MGKPKAPAPPDYAAAATAQGKANVDTSLASNFMNQVNQVNPYGSSTYSTDPSRSMTLADGTVIPGSTLTTTLSPEQQKLYDQNVGLSTSMNDLAAKGLTYADTALGTPIDTSTLPAAVGSVAGGTYKTEAAPGTFGLKAVEGAPEYQKLTAGGPIQKSLEGTNYQDQYDFSGVSQLPKYEDFNSSRDKITDAMMQRIQPYIDRDREKLRTQLVNQGIGQGTEAYGWDMDTFQRGVNDQRIAALLAGGAEQQNLFNNAMGLRQQGVQEAIAQGGLKNSVADALFNQRTVQGNFANQAQQQEFGQNQTITGYNNDQDSRAWGQNLQATAANNATQQQEFAQNQQDLQNYNQAQEAQFQQGLASGQFTNQARAQALQEAAYLKEQPINMLNSLRTGNQATVPSFSNAGTGVGIQPAPIYSATADQYNSQMAQYNAEMQAKSGFWNGLASIGGAAALGISDRRLKKNITKIGQRPDGLGWYAFDYIWDQPSVGTMADEVASLRPDALGPVVNGFATVNYGAL